MNVNYLVALAGEKTEFKNVTSKRGSENRASSLPFANRLTGTNLGRKSVGCECLHHLPAFPFQIFVLSQMLQGAAAAASKVPTLRFYPVRRRF